LRRFAVAAIVAICIGGPIVEIFENVVVAALCVGVAIAIGTIGVVARMRALSSNSRGYVVARRTPFVAVPWFASPIPTSSPPTPLRV
jgi:hypothetical protein